MTELSPNNYKKVIEKANNVRKINIEEESKVIRTSSGLAYFRDKIVKFLKGVDKNPNKWTIVDSETKKKRSMTLDEMYEAGELKMAPTPDFKNLDNDPKARGADGYIDDNIQGIIDEENKKEEEKK